MSAMQKDGANIASLRVDGGMVANNWILQFLADVLNMPVERPVVAETTALGAAYLAALGAGMYKTLEEVHAQWQCDEKFVPQISPERRTELLKGWTTAVDKVND